MSTIKEVAELAGVSIATVSYVINGTKHVAPATEARVHQAVETLNYRINHFASNIKSGKSGSIAFLMADMSNPFFLETAVSLEKSLREAKYNLILANTDEKVNLEKEQVDHLLDHAIDGLIIAPCTVNNFYLKNMLPANFPLVFFDRIPANMHADCVLSDNRKGSLEAVEYLISLGHKRIGIISGMSGLTSTVEREMGYIEALENHGIPLDRNLMLNGDGRKFSGYQSMQQLMDITDITAVFITNNMMSLGALQFLNDNKIAVPKNLSMVIFDDYDWSSMCSPSLTSVKQNTILLGKTIAEVILARLSGTVSNTNFCEHRIQTQLIKRASCLKINK
ncbi:LacI family DNA-binding transcriptional regulator [uncultured Sphaerochaeta sp.]|uniref:LacI family DNA-binding transcriptional regulator n=1 Tax=uncultured Sphaerochaeta sp. TaxID=886478 RepID=UPI002A0A561E|nr:LacI family DNA-binding transcriptional regulator [uncultured Sphaerochaeta sp.]